MTLAKILRMSKTEPPSPTDDEQTDASLLTCKKCPWTGDPPEYDLIDAGKKSKTAVCPDCQGQMKLNH
jgi:hypothetical protein